jgi:hypothetical protein
MQRKTWSGNCFPAAVVAAGLMLSAGPAGAQASAVDDIVGLRAGMGYDEIVKLLEARDDVSLVETAEQWIRQSHGIPTRQLLRAANGVPCAEGEAVQRSGGHIVCDNFRGRFEARKDITHEIVVAFTGMPEQERAGIVWRRVVFPEGKSPTVASLAEALAEKYGKPHIIATDSGYYSMSHRNGATDLNWVYRPDGSPIGADDSMKHRCVNGPKAWFAAEHSWNGGCGLTVRAEILPVPGNSLLASELHVSAVDQKTLLDHLNSFQAELKAAVELRAQGEAVNPDL